MDERSREDLIRDMNTGLQYSWIIGLGITSSMTVDFIYVNLFT